MQNVRACLGLLALAAACSSTPETSTFGDIPGGPTGGGGTPIIPLDAQGPGEASALPGDDCPASAPTQGSACTAGMTCLYDACAADAGTATSATCDGTKWTVTTAACAGFPCPTTGTKARDCNAGDICVTVKFSALQTGAACIPNPCGSGPLTCRCVKSTPASGCSGTCTAVVGREVQCLE